MKRLLLLFLVACSTLHVAHDVDPREMVDLATIGVALDLHYATTNPVAKAFLRILRRARGTTAARRSTSR